MLKITVAIVSILACMAFFITNAWGLDLQDGEYEIISTVEMPGMPMQIPPVTITQCLTPQDPLPNQSTAGQQCNIIDMNTKGNTVTWDMECAQQGQNMHSTGKMVYYGDRFEGTTNTKMGPQSGNMTIITVVKGKRIGGCQ
jgi:hypothetical protein